MSNKKKLIIVLSIIFLVIISLFLYFRVRSDILIKKYLKNKYNKDFEIVELEDFIIGTKPLFDFDSPPDHSGEFVYYYKIKSKDDNIIFDARYLNDNGKNHYVDSYKELKELYGYKNDITNSIKDNLDLENFDNNFDIVIVDNDHDRLDPSFEDFEYHIKVNINDDFSDSEEYSKKLYELKKDIFDRILSNPKNALDNGYSEQLVYYTNSEIAKDEDIYFIQVYLDLNYKDNQNILIGYDSYNNMGNNYKDYENIETEYSTSTKVEEVESIDDNISTINTKSTLVLLMDDIDNGFENLDFTNRTSDSVTIIDKTATIKVENNQIYYKNTDGKSTTFNKIDNSNNQPQDIASLRLICNGNAGLCSDFYYLSNNNSLFYVKSSNDEEDLTRTNNVSESLLEDNVGSFASYKNPLVYDYVSYQYVAKDLTGKIKNEEKFNFYNNAKIIGGWSYKEVYLISKEYKSIVNKYINSSDIEYLSYDNEEIIGKTYNFDDNTGILSVIDINNKTYSFKL